MKKITGYRGIREGKVKQIETELVPEINSGQAYFRKMFTNDP